MTSSSVARRLLAAAAAVLLTATASAARAVKYQPIDLGAIPGGYSIANGINNLGHVVGQARWPSTAGNHPFYFDGVTMHDLGTNGGNSGDAEAVNDSGWVVGGAGAFQKPFLWTQVGGMTILPTLGGDFGRAHGINGPGDIVGRASIAGNGEQHAVVWPAAGGQLDLGMLPGDDCTFSMGTDINDSGVVVGYSEIWDEDWGFYPYRAFQWTAATGMVDLGTLGGPGSEAFAINASGAVVGDSDLADGSWHAFMFDGTTMHDLGTLSDGDTYYSIAYDINNKGQVVGYSDMDDGLYHGFLWQDGTMVDLDTRLTNGAGWHIDFAYGINEDGWIACRGSTPRSPGTATAAILLKPIPKVPTTMWVRSTTGEPGRTVQLAGVLRRASDGTRIPGKTLTFTVGAWQTTGVTDAQGAAYANYPVPADATIGSEHTANVAFADEDDLDYLTCEGEGTLTIGKSTTGMWVRSPSGEPGRAVQLAGVLSRVSDGARVAGKTLTFTVGAWQTTGVTNAQGAAYVDYPVPSDAVVGSQHAITVAFSDADDPVYKTCQGAGTLTIAKSSTSLWVRSLTGEPGMTIQLGAVLMRARDGARVSGKTLTFAVGAWQTTGVTDAQGAVYVNYTVPAGTAVGSSLTVSVSFSDANDPAYKPCSGTGTITVVRPRTRVWVRSLSGVQGTTVQLCGVLMRQLDGTRIAGRTLHFSIGTWEASGVTNASGAVYVNYPIPLNAEVRGHTITVSFTDASDPDYQTSTGTGVLTVLPWVSGG